MKHTARLAPTLALGLTLLAHCGPAAPSPTNTPHPPAPAPASASPAPARPCLQGGDQNSINRLLQAPGDIAELCPGAIFQLSAPVILGASGQKIYTQGLPGGETRATLRITSATLTSAIIMRDTSNTLISHIIVDGNRPGLGPRQGNALIYAGGNGTGQTIRASLMRNTRSWSTLHLVEGGNTPATLCTGALVEDNQLGPAGTSDNWADGISLACTRSIIRRNIITDATDGGIVIFGAPGSTIQQNIIRAQTRTLLGGINMVDYDPYQGNYSGTIVKENIIDASGAVIRIGLGMGPRVWGCLDPGGAPKDTVRGATVQGNTLQGTYMQYGFAISGVQDWSFFGNVDNASHSGTPSVGCAGKPASPPSGFQYDPAHTQASLQSGFIPARLNLALWSIQEPLP